jgi:hypothetical protein
VGAEQLALKFFEDKGSGAGVFQGTVTEKLPAFPENVPHVNMYNLSSGTVSRMSSERSCSRTTRPISISKINLKQL